MNLSRILPPYTPLVWKAIGVSVGLLIVLGAALFTMQQCGTWRGQRSVAKDKAKIANTISEISNIQTQIANLEQQKAEKTGELKVHAEELANSIYGREEAKIQTGAAIANYQAAVNAKLPTDATAQQIEDALNKLGNQ